MPDDTFDAVIVGGGTKALFLAMYLSRYGGLSVGIFENRHEIGGCLATEENSAPGFRGNTHATIIMPWYYATLWRDFPEFWDNGGQYDQYLCSAGGSFRKTNTSLAIYSEKHDPTQERSAAQIAKFSERDAEKWLKFWNMWQSDEFQGGIFNNISLPHEEKMGNPKYDAENLAFFEKMVEGGFELDGSVMMMSHLRATQEWWECEELQHVWARYCLSVTDVTDTGVGAENIVCGGQLPIFGFARGGTHMIAHAAQQTLVQEGVKFFTHTEVKNVIIENGTATGIRLTDGSEIKARKLVVSGLSPRQLCFDLIGKEHLNSKLIKRIELLETTFACLFWYSIALHEAPKYSVEDSNPDIHETEWLALAEDPSVEHLANECNYLRAGVHPPIEDFCSTIWCHSLVDPLYAPPGKHVIQNEQVAPPASAHTEKEWMEIKKRFADELMTLLYRHAPNMTWDNVIGIDYRTPYDALGTKNLAPNGCWAIIDKTPQQQVDGARPTPELANHRTPIKNLYATGSGWWPGSSASAFESYTCYRIIAKDLKLGKPWEEPGKEEPMSLIESYHGAMDRAREEFKRDPQYGKE